MLFRSMETSNYHTARAKTRPDSGPGWSELVMVASFPESARLSFSDCEEWISMSFKCNGSPSRPHYLAGFGTIGKMGGL